MLGLSYTPSLGLSHLKSLLEAGRDRRRSGASVLSSRLKPETRNLKPETRNPEPETRNLEPRAAEMYRWGTGKFLETRNPNSKPKAFPESQNPLRICKSQTLSSILPSSNFSYLLLSSLELSDTKVYEPSIRAHLDTAARFCEVSFLQVPKSSTKHQPQNATPPCLRAPPHRWGWAEHENPQRWRRGCKHQGVRCSPPPLGLGIGA